MSIQIKYRGIPFSRESKSLIESKLRLMSKGSRVKLLVCSFERYSQEFVSASVVFQSDLGNFYAKGRDRSLNKLLEQLRQKVRRQFMRKKRQSLDYAHTNFL